jgi:signal transduction histidine kinase
MNALTHLRRLSPGTPDPALLFAAVEACQESLAIVDAGMMLYANPAWARTFECGDPQQLQGRAAEEFVPGHGFGRPGRGRDGAAEDAVAGPARNGSGRDETYAFLKQDGTQLHLEVACSGFRVRGQEYQVIAARDISGQKQIEGRLQQSERLEAVGRLVSGVAHDFNNLLTGLMLYCDLLAGELAKDSRSYLHAQEMRMAAEQGAKLVQQLLGVARPPAEETRGFVLNDVVTGVEGLLARLIGENVVLTASLAGDLGRVRMDPAVAQQILLNLALNARDAMPGGGQISLSTRNCMEYLPGGSDGTAELTACVELTVADNGCGMDPETLGRAFEPFFTTKAGQGNGLGLATAARLARQEGGTVVARSGLGSGTRVFLLLPRIDPGNAPDSKAQR